MTFLTGNLNKLLSPVKGKFSFKYAILVALIMLSNLSYSNVHLSPSSKVSILTCAPGDELYSIFGHTAIRVYDYENKIDLVFNYGTFNFSTPNFYLKFMQGRLNYMLTVTSYERFLFEYQYFKRSVWEQSLNMSNNEKNDLFRALILNADPKNREYLYHFFYDNCATRVRDMIANHFEGGIKFKDFPANEANTLSFRQAIATYLEQKPWIKLGLDIILGQPTDDVVDGETIQFLPDFLMLQFQDSELINGGSKPVLTKTTVFEFDNKKQGIKIYPSYLLFSGLVIIIFISWLGLKKGFRTKWLDVILFSITAAIGILITFLWFFTNHTVTGPNWNILWANPFHILLIFGPLALYKKIKIIYFLILSGLISILVLFFILPQYIPPVLVFVWLALIIRLSVPLVKH